MAVRRLRVCPAAPRAALLADPSCRDYDGVEQASAGVDRRVSAGELLELRRSEGATQLRQARI